MDWLKGGTEGEGMRGNDGKDGGIGGGIAQCLGCWRG